MKHRNNRYLSNETLASLHTIDLRIEGSGQLDSTIVLQYAYRNIFLFQPSLHHRHRHHLHPSPQPSYAFYDYVQHDRQPTPIQVQNQCVSANQDEQ
jgi:hypothetical protein